MVEDECLDAEYCIWLNQYIPRIISHRDHISYPTPTTPLQSKKTL